MRSVYRRLRLAKVTGLEEPAMWCRIASLMGVLLKRVALISFAAAFLITGHLAFAGNPIGDFFKRLGNSIAHPQSTPPPRRKVQKKSTGKKQEPMPTATPADTPPPAPPPSAPTNPPLPTPTPALQTIRTAGGVPPGKSQRRDMPYGIPVPNRPGLVTSPYSPKSGYVDVRGFPSGTEVKDPYTGKIFLTP